MTHKSWLGLCPSLLIAAGIVVSSLMAVHTEGWLVLSAPLFLALTVVSAGVLDSWVRGTSTGPSQGTLLIAGALPLSCLILLLRDPGLVKDFIPVLGGASAITLLRSNRRTCVGL